MAKRMKPTRKNIALNVTALMAAVSLGHAGEPSGTNAMSVTRRSVFDIPNSVKEGRDPFFPESTRVTDAAAAASASVSRTSTEVSSLKVRGISGQPGHLYAIINNHTFAVGDEGDVLTPNGRVYLRCIEIEQDAVVIMVGGHTHRIKLDTE